MDKRQFQVIRAEVAFWALLILSKLQTNDWYALGLYAMALPIYLWAHWPEREPGEGFWAKVWNR